MVTLSSVAEILNGDRSANYPSGNDFVSFGFPFINAGHLKNGKIDFSTMDYISEDKYRQLSGAKIRKNDILLCLRGSLGKYAVSNINEGAPASSIAVIRPNERVINSKFLTCVISSFIFQKQIDLANNGSSQPNLSASSVSDFLIPIPSLDEQELIAEALSDVDSMISSLEKLIAKKKAIKQGAMQELLTGKKRLPGFTGEWKCEANIFSFSKGTQINSSLLNETDIYPVYNGGREPSGFTDKFNCSRSIIISEGGNSCGFVNMVRQNFWAGGHCYYVYETVLDYEFLYHLLKFNENEIMGLRVGSGLPNIQKDALSKLEFTYPLDMLEQTAIASIFSDMDNEIEALEQKLTKTRQLKQGMMQQLLTGKIRLM